MLGSINRHYSVLRGVYELRKNQYLNREELEKLQEKKLKKLITHAYNNVPLYNAKFKSAGINPDDIRGLKDLSKIPSITKKEIRNSPLKDTLFYRTNLKNCNSYVTSGSTGTPLKVYQSASDYNMRVRYHYIVFECGLRLRDKVISLRVPRRKTEKHWFQKLGFLRRYIISINQPIQNLIYELINTQPDVLQSYPSIYLLLSQHIEKNAINPRISLFGGETLTEGMRKKINYVFNTELSDGFISSSLDILLRLS